MSRLKHVNRASRVGAVKAKHVNRLIRVTGRRESDEVYETLSY